MVLPNISQAKSSVALLQFENVVEPSSIHPADIALVPIDRQYDYLERALTDMLTTDLFNTRGIHLVERSRVELLLEEIYLGRTGLIEQRTAQKAGEALQADKVIYGFLRGKKNKIVIESTILTLEEKDPNQLPEIIISHKNIFRAEQKLAHSLGRLIRGESVHKAHVILQENDTVAILQFNDNSKEKKHRNLQKVLMDLTLSELASLKSIRLVERDRIQDVLAELRLGYSGYIDQRTAVKVGKLLGAQHVLIGSFVRVGEIVRVDVRLCRVETGEISMCVMAEGRSDKLVKVVAKLIARIRKALGR